jgi:hypothetical protein
MGSARESFACLLLKTFLHFCGSGSVCALALRHAALTRMYDEPAGGALNGHTYRSLWLPERIMQFNVSRLLSSADFITLQSFRWDFMCMRMRSMHGADDKAGTSGCNAQSIRGESAAGPG